MKATKQGNVLETNWACRELQEAASMVRKSLLDEMVFELSPDT